ncbi:MAG: hypothetical protein PWP34_1604 [Desulfuromonadales bacterium]|jgi:hypothetical protein|nr:hypothetical protein [Desulfuromonadales bacterium]
MPAPKTFLRFPLRSIWSEVSGRINNAQEILQHDVVDNPENVAGGFENRGKIANILICQA